MLVNYIKRFTITMIVFKLYQHCLYMYSIRVNSKCKWVDFSFSNTVHLDLNNNIHNTNFLIHKIYKTHQCCFINKLD